MNKGLQFWVDLWQEGRTSFHKQEVNPDLLTYWPMVNLAPGAAVLVPLCGKSLDMIWLYQQGLHVIGVEISEQAVRQFAQEHQLIFQEELIGQTKHFFTQGMDIWVADIFNLDHSLISPVDAIYDRAALIALPPNLHARYVVRCLNWLKPQGSVLLKTMSYNQELMQGPPYSIDDEELRKLYGVCSDIQCVKSLSCSISAQDPLLLRGLSEAKNTVWLLKK